MRNIVIFVAALSFCTSCTPKYTASFYYYNKPDDRDKNENASSEFNSQNNSERFIDKEISNSEKLTPESQPRIYSNASNKTEPEIFKATDLKKENPNFYTEKVGKAAVEKKSLKRSWKLKSSATAEEGSSKKNGFAITGFIFSMLSVLMWFVHPIFFIAILPGLLLSIAGLKSEKRGLARLALAGLIIVLANVALIIWLLIQLLK